MVIYRCAGQCNNTQFVVVNINGDESYCWLCDNKGLDSESRKWLEHIKQGNSNGLCFWACEDCLLKEGILW